MMWRFWRRKSKKPSHGETKIESDEMYQLRRRMSDLEQRMTDTELMTQLNYNAGPGQPVKEEWKG